MGNWQVPIIVTGERPYRVFPQIPNPALGSDTNDLSVTYRVQGEFPDFRVFTGVGLLIRSAYTETLY